MGEKGAMRIGAIILAGGRSRRMGKPKESLEFGDSTLLGHTAEILLECAYPVVVVARTPDQVLPPVPLEVELVYDDEPDEGPLRGLSAGLRRLREECDAAFTTGCDAPFLTGGAVAWLGEMLGDHDAVMPRVGSILQPLCAIYRCRALPVIESCLARGTRRPRDLVAELRVRVLDEEELRRFDPQLRFLRGVNTPEEYEATVREADSGQLS